MKNKFLHGAAAFAVCAGFVACSEYDAGVAPETLADIKSLQYETAFVQKFGKIDPAQDWGFGSGAETRANMWSHDDSWMNSRLQITLPSNYITITNKNNPNIAGSNTYYVDPDFDGVLNFDNNFAGNLYIGGKVTACYGQNFSTFNIYIFEDAFFEPNMTIQSGTITIYNKGVLKLTQGALNNQNIKTIYNGGDIFVKAGENYSKIDIADNISIYSNSTGVINFEGATDLKSTCDIHGTIYVDGKLNIQNSKNMYICGIVAGNRTNSLQYDINIDNDITTSYIKANNIVLNADNIFLTPGGYIKANKISTEGNGRTNANNDGYYEAIVLQSPTSSKAMVDVNEFYLKNDKLGNHLGAGVYTNFKNITYKKGGQETTATAATYSDELFDQSRINNTEIGGTSECGGAWGKTTKTLIESGRVFCEDLGSIGDFDFNDVVFDAWVYSDGSAKIVLWAAGGTLPITVAGFDPHSELGEGMVNTGVKAGDKVSYEFEKPDGGYTCINDIPVVVRQKDTAGEEQAILLKSKIGEAPQKICVPLDTRWMKEYEQINDGYTLFEDWVRGRENAPTREATFKQDSSTTDTDYLY